MKRKYFSEILRALFLMCGIALIFIHDADSKEIVSFTAEDGLNIAGDLYLPENNNRTFILLHGYGGDREDWASFAQELEEKGFGYLALDLRGHGASVSKGYTYEQFDKSMEYSEWQKMIRDIEFAVDFLVEQKNVKHKKIGIIGSDIGANLALRYAVTDAKVQPVIMISPGMDYLGIGTGPVVSGYVNRPLMIVSAFKDEYSYETCLTFMSYLSSNANLKFLQIPGDKHGISLIDQKFIEYVIDWLEALDR
ncbi:MAG: alpha/beta fold hydrolase [Elusimicrobiota bacterium]